MFKKVEIYLHAKFRWDNSVHSWDKTTSGFGKRMAAILEFSFRFRFWHMYRHRHVTLHLLAKFRNIRRSSAELWRHIHFSKMARRKFSKQMQSDMPVSAWFSNLVLIRFIVLDILWFLYFAVLAWNCLFSPILGEFWWHISPNMVTHRSNRKSKRTILARKHVVWAIKRINR